MEATALSQVLSAVEKRAVNETSVSALRYEAEENKIRLWSEEKDSLKTGIFFHKDRVEDILKDTVGWDAFYIYYESKKCVVAVLFDTTKI